MNAEKLKLLQASVRTGGKGSVRRKKKVVHKQAVADDKKLQATFKRLGVNTIPGIDEVNLFKDDGTVIHFKNPKMQANFNGNTYVVSGKPENKTVQDVLPSMITPDFLKNLAAQIKEGGAGNDEVPDLVENFEEAANKEDKPAEEKKE
jgi:nascent polypeptide-associated complex subunit beta|eukprot:TRINITY_DN9553_c0_g1_i1.p1 TRINITY_DN9553_c0_g1~~TRINITY_DN9553_c0_g1_i1.p1  ORF type:complete len:148 (-),score=60.21 TRINITY_DN9553_c0_g1_i1:65-508(-)